MGTTKKLGPREKQTGKLLEGQDFYFLHGVYLDGTLEFASKAKERAMWMAHREDLIKQFCEAYQGRMPWAWWCFDCGCGERGHFELQQNHESEFETLCRLNLLEKAKKLGFQSPQDPPAGLSIRELMSD